MSAPDISDSSRMTSAPPAAPGRYYRWLSHWRDLLAATRALRELVDARLPLAQGLHQLSQDAPRPALRHSLYWLHRELSGGMTLCQAMENQPDFFPPFYVKLIEAGENGGQLAEVLADLEVELQEQLTFRRRVASINLYLTITLFSQLLLVVTILTFVSPQITDLTYQFGGSPPAALQWANTLHACGLTLALLGGAIFLPLFWIALEFSRLRGGRLSQDWARIVPWIPLVGPAQRRGQLAAACAILGRLLRAGVPLPQAIRITSTSALPKSCSGPFARLATAVEGGEDVGVALNHDFAFFPATFRALVALGVSSGQLPEALQQASTLYRSQSVHKVRMALEMGAPLLIVLNGLLVFLVYGAFFITIMSFPLLIS